MTKMNVRNNEINECVIIPDSYDLSKYLFEKIKKKKFEIGDRIEFEKDIPCKERKRRIKNFIEKEDPETMNQVKKIFDDIDNLEIGKEMPRHLMKGLYLTRRNKFEYDIEYCHESSMKTSIESVTFGDKESIIRYMYKVYKGMIAFNDECQPSV